MSISMSCPHCERAYTLADSNEGKRVRCKDCGEMFTVTAAKLPVEEEEVPRERRKARRKKKARGVPTWVWAMGGGVIGLVVLVAAGWSLVSVLKKGGRLTFGGGKHNAAFAELITAVNNIADAEDQARDAASFRAAFDRIRTEAERIRRSAGTMRAAGQLQFSELEQ
jgi:predicted Zn finger-like uncharacterized protein